MTDAAQLDQASEDSNVPKQGAHEPSHEIQQQPPGRFSLARNKRAWLGIALSLIGLVAASAALIAVTTGGGTHQTTSATTGGASASTGSALTAAGSSKAGQASSGPTQAKSKVPSAPQSGGELRPPQNMVSRVITWQLGPGGTYLAAVSRLFGTALQEGAIRQYPEMRYTCTQLARSVSAAQAAPPIPVAAMQTLYGKALAELAKGAEGCQTAITVKSGDESFETKVNATMLHQSVSELALGARDIFRSTAKIEIAGRQAH